MRGQPDFSTTPRPRRPPAGEVLALVFAFVALGLALGSAAKTRGEARSARERLAGVHREIDSLEARLQGADAQTTEQDELLGRASAAGETPPDRIVAALALALPEDTRAERLTIDYGDAITLQMTLVARDASAWDQALDQLVRSGSFDEVIPGPERREGEIRVTLSARWAEESR